MTELGKPVRRRTRLPFAHYRRRIVVILEPGDVLAMRLERTRTAYRAPIASVYLNALRRERLLVRKKKRRF